MPDLRTLLLEAAPAPRRPLDMSVVRARAERTRTRRVWTWFVGVGAIGGLLVPAGTALVPADRGSTELGVGLPPVTATTEPATLRTADATAGSATPATVRPSTRAQRALPSTGRAGPPHMSAPAVVDPATTATTVLAIVEPPQPSHPPAPSCAVQSDGLAPGAQRSCRFTATRPGGASMRSTGPANPPPGARGEVLVTRDGKTTSHDVTRDAVRAGELGTFYCGYFIEPGDLVEVVLTNAAAPREGETITLGAGEDWACWE